MIQTTSYTPLESLLLFTWIRTRGAEAFEAATFPRVSYDLINNETIKQDPTYDAARLTPESLKELFLHLLHEELKDEVLVNESVTPDGPLSPNSKKRKRLGSVPKVTSLVEARQHAHRLPDAEAKLFAKYKQKVAQELWQEQEELRRLEHEISQLELKQKQSAQARKASEVRNEANGSPVVDANSVAEASRSPATAPTGEGWKPPAQPNGTASRAQSPLPAQVNVSNNFSPAPQVPSIRPSGTPPSHSPLVPQPPLPSPSPLGQGIIGPQEPARVPSTPAPVLQLPQNIHSPVSFPSHPAAATTPINEALQKPAHVLPKTDTLIQAAQSPQLPVSGSLKWEPPYQPHHGPHQQQLQHLQPQHPPQQHPQQQPQVQLQQQPQIQQRAPSNVSHLAPQQPQHYPPSWNAQPPLHFSHSAPLLPPQASTHPQSQQSARPILVAPHPGSQQSPLQPAPSRSHSSSPVPLQRPVGTPSPLSGPVRLPRSPYQHTQQVFAPPQPLPPAHNRIVPNVNSTPSPRPSPVTPQHAQWPKAPTPQQAVHGAIQPGQPAFSIPTGPPIQQPPAYNSPYPQPTRPALSPHTVPQQQPATIVGPSIRRPHPVLPATPLTMPFYSRPQGSGTKWTTAQPTPSTPEPIVGELQSPAFEPLSPVAQSISLPARTLKKSEKPAELESSNTDEVAKAPPLADYTGSKGSPSAASHRDEPSQVDAEFATKVKREDATPRPLDDAEDTTADESVSGQRQPASPRNPRASGKRKRQDSVTSDQRAASEFQPRLQPPPPPGIPTHVLWTRGFPRVSNSALEQIQSHKHANMFQNRIRPKEAPGYEGIIYKPQYLKNIQKAINAGHKAAAATAAALPGGDPGTSSVWLPISEDLVPPRAIINSAQLERELVQMFANAIMYNLDPNRGPGPAFMKGSGVGGKGANEAHGRVQSHAAGDAPNMIGYKVDENSVVKDTQSMFAEVDKLLIELRSTEAQPGVPPAPLPPGAVPASERLARGSVVTMADTELTPASGAGGSFATDEADEQQTDREGDGTSGNVKRRRLGRA